MDHLHPYGDDSIRAPSTSGSYASDGLTYVHTGDGSEAIELVERPGTGATLASDSSGQQFAPIRTGANRHHQDHTPATEVADTRELQRIYTTLSRRSSIAAPNDPVVDPSSSDFDLTKFLKMFRHQIEAEGIQMKKVGVVYKDLNVFGSGSALQIQQTVGDWLLAPARIGQMFSFKKERKQILHNFDGVVKSGEMLIVLGRPGSGCSTLLKTLCGELHGLEVDDKSMIHYNGIPQKQMMKEFKGEAIYNQEVSVQPKPQHKLLKHATGRQTLPSPHCWPDVGVCSGNTNTFPPIWGHDTPRVLQISCQGGYGYRRLEPHL